MATEKLKKLQNNNNLPSPVFGEGEKVQLEPSYYKTIIKMMEQILEAIPYDDIYKEEDKTLLADLLRFGSISEIGRRHEISLYRAQKLYSQAIYHFAASVRKIEEMGNLTKRIRELEFTIYKLQNPSDSSVVQQQTDLFEPLSHLDIPNGFVKKMQRHGINTVNDLLHCDKEVFRKMFAPRSMQVQQLHEKLSQMGLSVGMFAVNKNGV